MSRGLKSRNGWKRHSRQKGQHVQRPRGVKEGDIWRKLMAARMGDVAGGQPEAKHVGRSQIIKGTVQDAGLSETQISISARFLYFFINFL